MPPRRRRGIHVSLVPQVLAGSPPPEDPPPVLRPHPRHRRKPRPPVPCRAANLDLCRALSPPVQPAVLARIVASLARRPHRGTTEQRRRSLALVLARIRTALPQASRALDELAEAAEASAADHAVLWHLLAQVLHSF
jgi:hypothetical protein